MRLAPSLLALDTPVSTAVAISWRQRLMVSGMSSNVAHR